MAECSGGLLRDSQEISSQTVGTDMEAGNVQCGKKEEVQEELYEVEKIVGTTKINGRLLYKVRWRGYSPNWDTFEPVENLQTCLDLIDDFKFRKEELKKQRTLERKRRKALMEGRSPPTEVVGTGKAATVPGSHLVSSISDPDTLKDTFWRDLEEGKVNLFETDMYSKVKGQGRASRPTSFKPAGGRGAEEEEAEAEEESAQDNRRSNKGRSKNSRRSRVTGQKTARGQGGGKRRKSKVKKKNQKTKTETAFDRAQLDCHNGISTPESLCSVSSNSRTSSTLYTDVYSGKTVKSPVSLTSELMVKVERIRVGSELTSPALTPDLSLCTDDCSNSNSGESSDINNLNSNMVQMREDFTRSESDSSPDKTESIEKPAVYPNVDETDSTAAAARMVPKRPMFTEECLGGKKMKATEADNASAYPSPCEPVSVVKGGNQDCATMDKTTISAISETDCQGVRHTPGTCTNTLGATHHSINSTISVTSPSFSDKPDLACIQSAINEGSDIDRSCRGDKFADTSPRADSGEDFIKGEEESNSFTVGILGSRINLKEIDPEQLESELAVMKANPEVLELTERKFQDAVSEGKYEKVKKALNSSKAYNLDSIDATGMTLLMYAAQRGYDDIIDLLVSHGSRINAQQRNGTTSLMLACEHSQLHTVVLLVELGASLNLQQTSGETALMKAVKRGSKQIVKFLLERGANFASQTITGNSAMTYAKMLHVCDVEDMLFDHVARLTAEFDRQVAVTINNTAKIMCALFPLQCFPLCDGNKFVIHFKHELQPITPGVGYLLFVAHTRITPQEIKCRFYGPCAVTTVMLNGVLQPSLTQVGMKAEANFVLSCCPLNNGKNELVINTTACPTSKWKLVICAYKAKLME